MPFDEHFELIEKTADKKDDDEKKEENQFLHNRRYHLGIGGSSSTVWGNRKELEKKISKAIEEVLKSRSHLLKELI